MPGGAIATGGGLGGSERPANPWPGILMTAFAAFGGILFGYDTGTISGVKVMPDWLCTFGYNPDNQPNSPNCYITTNQESLVVSILSAGTFVGALLAAPMADGVGRKLGIIFSCAVFCVGVALQTAATAMPLFIVGRVIAGLGVGLVSCMVPMYQSECAPKWIRGAVVSCYQWAITIGLLLASIVANSMKNVASHKSYRLTIALQFIWAFILAGGMSGLPESPRYLIRKGHDDRAARSLARLLTCDITDPRVEAELQEIRINLEQEREMELRLTGGKKSFFAGYAACFKQENHIFFRTMTGIFLQAWQQLTGINFIFYYGTTFFKNSGISDPFLISVATNVVNVGSTIPGILAVDRVGRRNLLLWGAAGMCFCEFLVAIIGVTISVDNKSGQKVLIAFVCIYIFFFASTWGPIAWVVTGEIYPLEIRAKAMSMSTASNWLWNFAIGYATPYLVNPSTTGPTGMKAANLGPKVFFIWGSTCACCCIFTFFCIPETKGLSLEQIDLLYQNTVPWKSKSYRALMLDKNLGMQNAEEIQDMHRTYTGEKSVPAASATEGSDVEKNTPTHTEQV
ncbi:general substrate transporter [Clavulina sp. PMI_390]|nr:general substrate transporter [Clavulina sp. PMI_390]